MSVLLVCTLTVALAEIGDRTQLLAMVLAARWRRPWTILAGILAATLANHALAAGAGFLVTDLLAGRPVRVLIALAFIAMAAWTLIPDKLDAAPDGARPAKGVFTGTLIAFFLVEMGDKTQIATVALAARFQDIAWVTLGTTAGMMIANAPAVFAGPALLKIAPLRLVRFGAAAVFFLTGVWALREALA
ncbi:MAG: TMEM165/GDT1 family protein [Hyphomonadaceae bacterium]|nr:TMEM165/GDT1 family protein [Hyphomonadaceae bacterium]